MHTSVFSILSAALLASSALAELSFNTKDANYGFDSIIKTDSLSKGCAAAYTQKLKCSSLLFQLRDNVKGPALFTKDNLNELCTSDCIDSLNDWDKKVNKACSNDDKKVLEKAGSGALYINMALDEGHVVQRNLYWAFCLKDETPKVDKYCLLDKNLPPFPTGSDTSRVAEFCLDKCRTQQSYLVHVAAKSAGYKLNDFDAASVCPNVDPSSFTMNVVMLNAFGVNAEKTSRSTNNSPTLEGTGYSYKIYSEDLKTKSKPEAKSKSKAADDKPSASASASNATASGVDGNNAAIRPAAASLWIAFGLAGVVAAML